MDTTRVLSPRVAIMELCAMCSVPMALKAALTLNVFEIMAALNKPVSAEEIVNEMPPTKSPNHANLDRIMRLLASYNIFHEYVDDTADVHVSKYELSPLGKALARRDDGLSLGSLVHVNQDKTCLDMWQFLHEAVTDGDVEPFVKCHGKTPREMAMEDPTRSAKLYSDSMAATAVLFMEDLLNSDYKGFEGIDVLVDVGGGTGKSLSMIVAKYPSIKAINFDLPHVIQHAPIYPGVKHEMGSMLHGVPSGDAMLLKRVLHNWGDEECVKILRRCYERVAERGKVIVVDCVLPSKAKESAECRAALELDLHMMALFKGARERRLNDFRSIGHAAGFKSVKLVHQLDVLVSVVELHKH